jgi:hypothetical protein
VLSGEIITIGDKTHSGPSPKSLADILAEELDEKLGGEHTQELPVAEKETRLQAVYERIHKEQPTRSALCLSGGGIRSAAFGLGVLQGLARCGLLNTFHYLSTVSGGGYIGSWLSAWVKNHPQGIEGVIAELIRPPDSILEPEPRPIRYLREFSNYLAPKVGLTSVDFWTLIATYFRNITAMSLVLVPLLAAALTIPWLLTATFMISPTPYTSVPLWIGMVGVAMGTAYVGIDLPSGGNKRRSQRSFLAFCLLPLLVAAFSMTTYWAWFSASDRTIPKWSFLGLTPPHPAVPFIYLSVLMYLLSGTISGFVLGPRALVRRRYRSWIVGSIMWIFSGAILGSLLWLFGTKIFPRPLSVPELYTVFGVPLFLGIFFLDTLVWVIPMSRWSWDEDRQFWSRAGGWVLSASMTWIAISILTLFGPLLVNRMMIWGVSTITVGGVIGFLVLVGGRFGVGSGAVKGDSKIEALVSLIFNKTIAAYLFGIALIIFAARALTWGIRLIGQQLGAAWNPTAASGLVHDSVEHLNVILYTPVWVVLLLAIGLSFFGTAMGYLINPNRFSLQWMYRVRLIGVFLGASRMRRKPNLFTGFDPDDNIALHQLPSNKPLHIINGTLNLVLGAQLAWQERKAESFTMSRLHCGSWHVGYRPSAQYGNGITLGTAMALSGAAPSPNMGYYTSPLVRLVFTLLNVRLGGWLGNPGSAGHKTFHLACPNFSVGPIISDAFGLISDRHAYANLSDARHFESLGLYEIVLRRCHYIVVCDPGRDPESLGGAVLKIRVDLGIPIEFEEMNIFPRSDDPAQKQEGRNCTIGRIRYSRVDGSNAPDGVIVYIKAACYGDKSHDVYEYFKTNPDHFVSESQFESYRWLGAYTIEELCANCEGDFRRFIRDILKRHLKMEAPAWLAPLLT